MNIAQLDEDKNIKINNQKINVHFENNFGKIFGNKIYFKSTNQEQIINDIAYMKIIFFKDTVPNIVFFLIGTMSLIVVFLFNFKHEILLIASAIISFLTTVFYKKKKYSIQIVLTIAEQQFVTIKKSEIKEALLFVKKVIDYKESNPEFMTMI